MTTALNINYLSPLSLNKFDDSLRPVDTFFAKTYITTLAGAVLTALFLGCAQQHPITAHTPIPTPQAQSNQPVNLPPHQKQRPHTQKHIAPFPSSDFLRNLTEADLNMIIHEVKRTTHPHWQNIDNRAQLSQHRILRILKDMNAPDELLFVPVAESGYNPYALSPTGALGLWQLMPKTALELGVTHKHGLDGRRHIEHSTHAAISYLLKLYKRFDDWILALAAYNLGPWGVQKRLKQTPWQPKDGLNALPFPAETRYYIKQILGMIALSEQGELTFSEPIPTVAYPIAPPIDLTHLEKVAGLKKNDLFRLNPELDHQRYLKRSITLHLPQESIRRIEQRLQENPNLFKPKFVDIRVKPGDSLWKIAHRHHTNIAYLRKLNPKLKPVLSIGQLVKVPASGSFATAAQKTNPLLTNGKRIRYKVKHGDSLWTIAKKFGTSSKAIARMNQIPINQLLRPGDRLWIVARFRPS